MDGVVAVALADPDPTVESSSGQVAGAVGRLYFTGYTIFTLGNGDFQPLGPVWQLATVAMTGTGLILVTLSITYLVPMATAAASQRQLSTYIFSLGETPEDIVVRGWTGEGFDPLQSHLTTLAPMLHAAGQSHLTYPVLHFLHPTNPHSVIPNAISNLVLALDLVEAAVHPSVQPHPVVTSPCRDGIPYIWPPSVGHTSRVLTNRLPFQAATVSEKPEYR